MLDYFEIVKLDGTPVVFHETVNRALSRVEGLIGLPQPRKVTLPRTEAPGNVNRSRWSDERTISLEGEVWGATHPAAYDEWDVLADVLGETLEADDDGLVARYRQAGGGDLRQMKVKLDGEFAPPLEGGARRLVYKGNLVAPDPRAYSQTPKTATGNTLGGGGGLDFPMGMPFDFNPGGNGQLSVTNAGTAPTPAVLFVYGQIETARIRLLTTGQEIVLSGIVPAGQYLQIDVRAKTLRMNAATDRADMLNAKLTSFFEIPKGTHTLQLIGDADNAAHLGIEYRDAYKSG